MLSREVDFYMTIIHGNPDVVFLLKKMKFYLRYYSRSKIY